jgi:hypothetical protein
MSNVAPGVSGYKMLMVTMASGIVAETATAAAEISCHSADRGGRLRGLTQSVLSRTITTPASGDSEHHRPASRDDREADDGTKWSNPAGAL